MTSSDLITYVVNAGSKVYKLLGPGLSQEVYEECLVYELSRHKIKVERQKEMSVEFEELTIEKAFVIDLFVGDKLVVGLKPDNTSDSLFRKRVETFAKLCGFSTGLIIDFNTEDFRSGVKVIEKAFRPIAPPMSYGGTYYGKYTKKK